VELSRVVVKRRADGLVRGLNLNKPMHAAIASDDKVDFASLLVTQVKDIPVLNGGIFSELREFEQASGVETRQLRATRLMVCGDTIVESELCRD